MTIVVSIACSVFLSLVAYLIVKRIGIQIRDLFALIFLITGCCFAVGAGFTINSFFGITMLSVVFLMLAFLLGYERG